MELRVWVDGTQRVVCGVKLTTTCQEIVFALAHATQQAGRFIMIERWRNNERLLSPNEQPLVTLQRWGARMNEVEYILRKTSTDSPTNNNNNINNSTNNIQQQQQQLQQQHQQQQQPATMPPPVVPAKPRVIAPLALAMSYYQPIPSPKTYFNNNNNNSNNNNGTTTNIVTRPRNPPCYSDYIKAMANRRPLSLQPPLAPSSSSSSSIQNDNINFNVSQAGHDMLKQIEEQKKVLLNQKNEIDLLDNDKDDCDTITPEQIELIKDKIQELEELWKTNQIQIKKLENQYFEKKLQELRSEQIRMEDEIGKQKEKLIRCEKDIKLCNNKIELLELELSSFQKNCTSHSLMNNDDDEEDDDEDDHEDDESDDDHDQNGFKDNVRNNNVRVHHQNHVDNNVSNHNHDSGADESDELNLSSDNSKQAQRWTEDDDKNIQPICF